MIYYNLDLKYKKMAAFVAVLLPLSVGIAASGALLRSRTLLASIPVREERVGAILSAVEKARSEVSLNLASILPPAQKRSISETWEILSRAGWRVMDDSTVDTDPAVSVLPADVAQAFRDRALRDGIITEFVLNRGRPLVLVGVSVGSDRVLTAGRSAAAMLARTLGSDPEMGAALYVDGIRVVTDPSPLGSLLPHELDGELVARVIGEDRPVPMEPGKGGVLIGGVVPLKDFESWDVTALLVAATPRSRIPGIDEGVGAGVLVLLVLLGLAAAGCTAWCAGRPPGAGRVAVILTLIPLVSGALLYRDRVKEVVEMTLKAGLEPLQQTLAAGGLVEQYSFGAELLTLVALVITMFWIWLVLLVSWNLEKPPAPVFTGGA